MLNIKRKISFENIHPESYQESQVNLDNILFTSAYQYRELDEISLK